MRSLLTPDVVGGLITVIVAVLGLAATWLTKQVKKIREDTKAARTQVTNHHATNLRDDVSDIAKEVNLISTQLMMMLTTQKSHGHQLGEIRREIEREARDRQQLADSVNDNIEASVRDRALLWEAVRARQLGGDTRTVGR